MQSEDPKARKEAGWNDETMKFVTGCDGGYKVLMGPWIRYVEAQGYEWEAFNLGGLGFGINLAVGIDGSRRQICHAKCHAKLEARRRFRGPLAWLDADAYLVDRVDELEEGDWDVALYRHPSGKYHNDVIFLQDTEGAIKFLEEWSTIYPEFRSDTRYMNNMIKKGRVDGVKIKDLPQIYDWDITYERDLDTVPDDLKILHFKARQDECGRRVDDWNKPARRMELIKAWETRTT